MDKTVSKERVPLSNKLLRTLIRPGLKLDFHGIADWFLLSVFVLPSYFGVRVVFFDLTALRFFEVLLLCMILKNKYRKTQFVNLVRKCPNIIWINSYMFVVIYTNLLHPSINTILYWFTNCVLITFCVAYLIVYEYGVEVFLSKIKKYIWILCVLSPVQVITGMTPFSLLDTLGKVVTTSRFGEVRIMGNCTVANGYAMYITMLMPIMCYNLHTKRIDFKNNKLLLFLMAINIFLTGSRLSVGMLFLELFLCFIMQDKKQLKQSIMVTLLVTPIIVVLIYSLKNLSFVQGLLRTFFSAFDELFNTNYAVQFGADAQILYNSSYYRELLWRNTIGGDWLNPWLGKGGSYNFGLYVEGYRMYSCDNFYVGQYITYGLPGVITWLLMSFSFLVQSLKCIVINKDKLMWVMNISIVCYFISLWYLDQLQTFPFMMAIFGVIYSIIYEERGLIDNGSEF